MLHEKLSTQIIDSILSQKMSLEHLLAFLHNYPDVAKFLNNNYCKIPMVFTDAPHDDIIATENHPDLISIIHKPNVKKEKVFLEIPCVHFLLFQFKNHYEQLLHYFDVDPFKVSFLHKNDKKYLLLGFNVYALIGLKMNQAKSIHLIVHNKEEFMNFYYEKKNRESYISVFCDSLFPLFDFKLQVEDLLYKNDEFSTSNRSVSIYLGDKKFQVIYKNLNEFTHHERIPLDNLIQYKINEGQIDFEFDFNSFFDFLVTNNYFTAQTSYKLCLELVQKKPELFTPEIMALLCLKNKALHDTLIQHYPNNRYTMLNDNKNDIINNHNISTNKQTILHSYQSVAQETFDIVQQLLPHDEVVKIALDNLKNHIDNIVNENGLAYLAENIEDRITFESILSKYIPSILNNYLSIPSHLRAKPEHNFINMTLEQFTNLEKELEKIEVAIISEDVKKMKVFGKFLDTRLGNNTKDILNLN